MKSLNRVTLSFCFVLVAVLMNVQFIQAQETKQPKGAEDESPSLQETFNWLKSKLEKSQLKFRTTEVTTIDSIVGKGTDTSSSDSNISSPGSGDSGSEPLKQSDENKVNLSEIDPLGLKVALLEVDTSSVNTEYRNQRVKSTNVSPEVWFVSFDKTYKAGIYGSVLFFEEREIAKRVAKAFQNAVKKCGGKVEPF